jgi:DNA-binding MarR family transcriptional regulator
MSKANDAYQIVWLVRRLFRAMAERSNESLLDLGVSAADRAVLEFLYPEEKLSVPEIAERYQVSRQHVQITVNNLLKSAYITKIANPRHKRSPLMALTSKGRALFKTIRAQDTKTVNQLFSHISESDMHVTQETLKSLLEKLK